MNSPQLKRLTSQTVIAACALALSAAPRTLATASLPVSYPVTFLGVAAGDPSDHEITWRATDGSMSWDMTRGVVASTEYSRG